jgi:hypothetical protein
MMEPRLGPLPVPLSATAAYGPRPPHDARQEEEEEEERGAAEAAEPPPLAPPATAAAVFSPATFSTWAVVIAGVLRVPPAGVVVAGVLLHRHNKKTGG